MQDKSVWNIEWFDTVTSTNDIAKQISESNIGKTVIVAESQTAGRGRRGNNWVSQKGNLFFSQLFENKVLISYLPFVTSLSVFETIKDFFPKSDVSIKWPNDILIKEKKTAGILIETTDNGMIIIGIGVNTINNPDKYQTTYSTTNLKSLGDIDNNEFLKQYLINFDKNYIMCINDFSLIRKKWLSYAARLNQEIKVKRKDNIDIGIFRGIDEHGFLLLEQSGKQQKISVAEVFF